MENKVPYLEDSLQTHGTAPAKESFLATTAGQNKQPTQREYAGEAALSPNLNGFRKNKSI